MNSANVRQPSLAHTDFGNEEGKVSRSRGNKVKSLDRNQRDTEVFWMSLEEAKRAIADKYEFLAERYERRYPKQVHK